MTSELDSAALWGGSGRSEGRLSLSDLVRNNTLSAEVAALLTLLMERKKSVLVAAGPQLAGKTTLLAALVETISNRYGTVLTKGQAENFAFLQTTEPDDTYILVPELSDHTPAYLWGPRTKTLFDALERGYSLAATMHADYPQQALHLLRGPGGDIPEHQLHLVDVIVTLKLMYGRDDMVRRVNEVTLVTPGPVLTTLAAWDLQSDSFGFNDSDEAVTALTGVLGTEAKQEVASRAQSILSEIEQESAG